MGNENLLAISLKLRFKKKVQSQISYSLKQSSMKHQMFLSSSRSKMAPKMSEATSNYKHVNETVISATIWQLRVRGQSNHKLSCYC